MAGGKEIPHRRHLLQAKLDCAECHSTTTHGQPAFPRNQCGGCHHQTAPAGGELKCATCHALQQSTIAGNLEGFKGDPSPMAEAVSCDGCHGQAPDIARPKPETCAGCHDDSYGKLLTEWQTTVDQLRAQVEQGLLTAAARGIEPAAIESARKALDAVVHDGSRGGHNFALVEATLTEAAKKLGVK
jgi:class III cytochrome C family protein